MWVGNTHSPGGRGRSLQGWGGLLHETPVALVVKLPPGREEGSVLGEKKQSHKGDREAAERLLGRWCPEAPGEADPSRPRHARPGRTRPAHFHLAGNKRLCDSMSRKAQVGMPGARGGGWAAPSSPALLAESLRTAARGPPYPGHVSACLCSQQPWRMR